MKSSINVMQMIDSLSVGGAERVSINYSNALSESKYINSFMCVTREEGLLKKFIKEEVNYFFMNKKNNIDYKSFFKLYKFIKENKIDIIHAHSTSFFTASIIKIFTGVKIVWHDHYGRGEDIDNRKKIYLKFFSPMFSYIISVNEILKKWAITELFVKKRNIEYIQNYADLEFTNKKIVLPGKKGKRIVLLANLREAKNHFLALKSFKTFLEKNVEHNDWSLILVGKDFNDEYSNKVKSYIKSLDLLDNIFYLGARSDTPDILKNVDIGLLSSNTEGLPVTLLEYGLAKLPIISTNVGQCSDVLNNGKVGILIKKNNKKELTMAFETYIKDFNFRQSQSEKAFQFMKNNFSKSSVIEKLLSIYLKINKK